MKEFKPIMIDHKGNPGMGMLAGVVFFVICIGVSVLVFFLSRDFLKSADPLARSMPFVFSFFFLLAGAVVNIVLIRQEYHEHIEITRTRVKYEKKGRLRKNIKWIESLQQYNAVEDFDEDAVEDTRNYCLKLKHVRFRRKDILLEKNLASEREMFEKKHYYLRMFDIRK